jgi:hypothetical protein
MAQKGLIARRASFLCVVMFSVSRSDFNGANPVATKTRTTQKSKSLKAGKTLEATKTLKTTVAVATGKHIGTGKIHV